MPSLDVETFLAIGLGLAAAYFGWRFFRVRKSLGELARLLSDESLPALPAELPGAIRDEPAVAALSRAFLDGLTEVTLTRDLETSNRQFLEALLNEIEDGIFVLGEELEIRFSNRAAGLLFPSDQPHVGRSLIQVCLDHRIVDAVELATEVGGKIQEQINRRAGSEDEKRAERAYMVEAEPLSELENRRGAWLLIRDITLQLETEQIRQDFVANASHELRTPLSIINGYLEMLDRADDPPDLEAARRSIATMRKHGERISLIVEDMLTISKLEGHSAETLNRERFDIGECIGEIIEHLQPLIDEQKAKVKVELSEARADREFEGDRFYWDQVFFNLIENALKQNPQPGLRITISVSVDDGRFQIGISDDGVGIPASDIPHIFKRFYRVQKDHAQTIKGTGLGLSIVKRAVEAHHGTISVRSQPGRETTFTISTPRPLGIGDTSLRS